MCPWQMGRDTGSPGPALVAARGKNDTLRRHLQQLAAVLSFKRKRHGSSNARGDGGNGAATHDAGAAIHAAADLRPQFGGRVLRDAETVFTENAWDDVKLDQEQLGVARAAVEAQALAPVSAEERATVENAGGEFWDHFYRRHENKFFKDRHWLMTEFAELMETGGAASLRKQTMDFPRAIQSPRWLASAHASRRVLEVGCGVGNTIFPLLDADADPSLFVYGCDFAPSAVDIVRTHVLYDPRRCHAFVCDVSTDEIGLPPDSLDVIVLIFVLSAINPARLGVTLKKLAALLKPGGMILLRDYGRYDLAQLRFKGGRYLSENFYIRGDRTKVYFFTREEMKELMESVGLEEMQNRFDNRLLINRATQQKMYRVWLQCKYRKPAVP